MPRPKKLRVASTRMMVEMRMEKRTMMGAMMFGRMCFNSSLRWDTPMDRAANT